MNKLLLATCALSLPVALVGASPAEASSRWSYRSTDLSAMADVSITGALPGASGNVHLGSIYATSGGWAEVYVSDWTCPDGAWPYPEGDGGEGYPPEESPCTFEGAHDYSGGPDQVAVSVSKKLAAASIRGTLTSSTYDEETGTESTSTVDVGIAFTGTGATWSTTDYSKDAHYTYKYATTSRAATVSGSVANLDLGAASSSGTLTLTRSYERGMTK
ncbi:hypothetical protein [Nocardioides jiangxiensis]|uniref:Uncharacterized protein n=1 Tax=Nocardioides jiangxiensis TaxID=3064524 RepID=A0ABT9B3X5_9ACTN|nr:hypothetical protein [Nocardioides sp. WY-20]MDO7868292.1 hypothetical protein [Nocardioides sp. WY-20]